MKPIAYWLLWPLTWVYAPLKLRARILVVHNDTFLVVLPKFGNGKWQLPGGGVRKGESALAAAVRELHEETGLEANIADLKELVPTQTYSETRLLLKYIIFTTQRKGPTMVTLRSNEIAAYKWLSLSETPKNCDKHVLASLSAFTKMS